MFYCNATNDSFLWESYVLVLITVLQIKLLALIKTPEIKTPVIKTNFLYIYIGKKYGFNRNAVNKTSIKVTISIGYKGFMGN